MSKQAATLRQGRVATNLTVIDQALVSGTNFITGLILARILGIEAYGLFILLTGVILFTSNIQNAMIVSPMMVSGPAHKHDTAHQYYQATAVLQATFTIVTLLLVITIGTLLNNTILDSFINDLILPLALATTGLLLQEYFRRYFFSIKNPVQALINDALSYGLQIITIIAIHFIYGINIELCLYIMAITSYIAVIHGIISSRLLIQINKISLKKLIDVYSEHWVFGKWLLAKNITYWFGTQMVIYMTGIFLSIAAVGAMGAARNIVGVANILFLALENFATPRASQSFMRDGIDGLSKYTRRLAIVGGAATAGIVLIASIAPEFWLNLVYSDEYKGYGWVVIAWALYYMIGYFQKPTGISLRVLGATKSIFTGTLIGTIIAILMVYPAISFAGLHGAMATLIAVQTAITLFYFYSYSHNSQMCK